MGLGNMGSVAAALPSSGGSDPFANMGVSAMPQQSVPQAAPQQPAGGADPFGGLF